MTDTATKLPVVLVVEDDPHSRAFMESSLELSGFKVLSTESAESAREICERVGVSSISTVLSDYRLPNQTGTEFIDWIRSKDRTVSTVIITGQGEKSIVEQSLSAGAYRYLEKPVTHQELKKVIISAVGQTLQQRQFASDRQGLQALEQLGQTLNAMVPEALNDRLSIVYKPLCEVGGDFFITYDFGGGRYVILVGDISGHDIRSGYVSTYFQGMFRGSLEGNGKVPNALELFNRSLRQQALEGFENGEGVSLSLSTIDFSLSESSIRHWNFGFTPCQIVSLDGRIQEGPFGRFPLGWVEEIDANPVLLPVGGNGALYVFTDGLIEFANSVEINYFSLLYRILRSINPMNELLVKQSDDILILRYLFSPEIPVEKLFEPILSEHYAGTEVEHIDMLQANWRRSLVFSLGDQLGDRLFDLLICIREGMLNALTHGCEGKSDKFAHLQISLNADKNVIRVFIDDPGRGHSFDLKARLEVLSKESGKHLGLGIIQHLSDAFNVENEGTSLVFDFQVNPGSPQ